MIVLACTPPPTRTRGRIYRACTPPLTATPHAVGHALYALNRYRFNGSVIGRREPLQVQWFTDYTTRVRAMILLACTPPHIRTRGRTYRACTPPHTATSLNN